MADDSSDFSVSEDLHNATGIAMTRPKKRRKLVLKKRLKSIQSSQICKNTSFNSKIVTETLRMNNRALARRLERTRGELADTQHALLACEGDKQELQAQLSLLRRVAGLKNDQIDAELQLRMSEKMDTVRRLMDRVSRGMLDTADLITVVMGEVGESSRVSRGASLSGTRSSSSFGKHSLSPDVVLPTSSAESAAVKRRGNKAPSIHNDTGSGSGEAQDEEAADSISSMSVVSAALGKPQRVAMRVPQLDLSLIQEQSVLMDSTDIQFTEEEEEETQRASLTRKQSRSRSKGKRSKSKSTGSASSSRRHSRRSELHPQLQIDSSNPQDKSTGEPEPVASPETKQACDTDQNKPGDHSAQQPVGDAPQPAVTSTPPHGSQTAPTPAHPVERPITSKFAPHISLKNPTPASSPNCRSPFNPDATEFFSRFVPLESAQNKPHQKEVKKKEKITEEMFKSVDKSIQGVPTIPVNDLDVDNDATELYNYADWQLAAAASNQSALQEVKEATNESSAILEENPEKLEAHLIDQEENKTEEKKSWTKENQTAVFEKSEMAEEEKKRKHIEKKDKLKGDRQMEKAKVAKETKDKTNKEKVTKDDAADEKASQPGNAELDGKGDRAGDSVTQSQDTTKSSSKDTAGEERLSRKARSKRHERTGTKRSASRTRSQQRSDRRENQQHDRENVHEEQEKITPKKDRESNVENDNENEESKVKSMKEKPPVVPSKRRGTFVVPTAKSTGEEKTDDDENEDKEEVVAKKIRRGTFAVPAPPDEARGLQTKSQRSRNVDKSSKTVDSGKTAVGKSTRRGTFVVPLPQNNDHEEARSTAHLSSKVDTKEEKSEKRRGTFCVNKQVKSAQAKETDAPKAVDDIEAMEESGYVDIFNEGASILINSRTDNTSAVSQDTDRATSTNIVQIIDKKSALPQGRGMDATICEAEDMELTEVISASQIAMAMSKIPNPSFVRNVGEPSFLRGILDSAKNTPSSSPQLDKTSNDQTNEGESSTNKERDNAPNKMHIKEKNKHKKTTSGREEDKMPKGTREDDILTTEDSSEESSHEKDSQQFKSKSDKKPQKSVSDKSLFKQESKSKPSKERGSDLKCSEKKHSGSKGSKAKHKRSSSVSSLESDKDSGSNPSKEKQRSSSVSSTEGDNKGVTARVDVAAYFKKPGKIHFTAGRRNLQDIMHDKPSTKSTLPRMRKQKIGSSARSKPRLLPSTSPLNASRTGPKNVFDLSLNESIPVPSSISYGQFRECQVRKESEASAKAAPASAETETSENTGVLVDEHGIMLVLGNGKRTKPRHRKSVRYAEGEALIDEHLITPAVRGEEKRIPGLDMAPPPRASSSSKAPAEPGEKKHAGHTPPRKPLSKTAHKKNSEVIALKNQEVVTENEKSETRQSRRSSTDEESPFIGKSRKRKSRIAVIDDTSDSEVFESPIARKKKRSSGKGKEDEHPADSAETKSSESAQDTSEEEIRPKEKKSSALARLKQKLVKSAKQKIESQSESQDESETASKTKPVSSITNKDLAKSEPSQTKKNITDNTDKEEMIIDENGCKDSGKDTATSKESSRKSQASVSKSKSDGKREKGRTKERAEKRNNTGDEKDQRENPVLSSVENSPMKRKQRTRTKERAEKRNHAEDEVEEKENPVVVSVENSPVKRKQKGRTKERAEKRNTEETPQQQSTEEEQVLQKLWDEVTLMGDLPTDDVVQDNTPARAQQDTSASRDAQVPARATEPQPATSTATLQPEPERESGVVGRRARRATTAVSYKEMSINQKLRRGDEVGKTIYSGKDAPSIDIYKKKQKAEELKIAQGPTKSKRSSKHKS